MLNYSNGTLKFSGGLLNPIPGVGPRPSYTVTTYGEHGTVVVVWKDTFINNRKSQMASNCTMRFNTNQLASTVWISQMGIRPAVWTEEQDYTPLAKPYMSVDEYF